MEQTTTRDFIPEEYRFAHDYCFFLHDVLADIVVHGEQEGVFSYSFDLKSTHDAEQFADKSGEELAEWLERNGYQAEFREANRRHICVALLSDFCHFVYEALECSRKGKLTVTFALLRKPLKENLFYLEWLLARPDDFMERFHAPISSNRERPLPLPTSLSKRQRLDIIREAINKTELGSRISPGFIYELRYDKKCDYGFERLFQRAIHLVTTFTARTEEQNFNFIFSDGAARLSQWQGLYTLLPVLLLHSLLVVERVIRDFDEDRLEDLDFLRFRALAGFLLYVLGDPWTFGLEPDLVRSFKSIARIEVRCLGCQRRIALDESILRDLYFGGVIECEGCGYKTLLTGNSEFLLMAHLAQDKVSCPSCDVIVSASKENLASFKEGKIICQECGVEISIEI